MPSHSFRKTLAAIILAAPFAGCTDPPECPAGETRDVLVAEPDAALTTLLQGCWASADCEPLCREVYRRVHGYELETDVGFVECGVTIDGESSLDLVHYQVETFCIGGRRPEGYRDHARAGRGAGAYLARQAALEAASVRAFADLVRDLVSLRAPAPLVRAAVRAAGDEIRHAETCARLARRAGVAARMPAVRATARRDAEALAVENAAEGCVRETLGAVVAHYQARHASDPVIRRAMHAIARDEARHAALSWRLHRWLAPQLDAAQAQRVAAAAAAARAELEATEEASDEERRVLGLPDRAATHALLRSLDADVLPDLLAT